MANDRICLNENYSTTRIATQDKLIIDHMAEDKFESILFLSEGENRKGEGGLRTKGYFKKPYEDKPLITIITVVFNGEKYLEETIRSVIYQNYDNVEYIIIDGGSIDGTLDIIKKYEDQIDYWVSEKDKGIYDAMNKGIILASGDYIGLINADDSYHPYTLNEAMKFFTHNTVNKNCIIYGNTYLIENNNVISFKDHIFNQNLLYLGFQFSHTSIFTSLSVYKSIGLFNINYSIAGDTDWLLRALGQNIPFIKNTHKNYMKIGGISHKHQISALYEYSKALKTHLPDYYNDNIEKIETHIRKIELASRVRNLYVYKVFKKTILETKKNIIGLGMICFNILHTLIFIHNIKNKIFSIFGIKIGKNSYIHKGVKFYTTKNINIGDNCTINSNCVLDNRYKIFIGNNINIGHACKIYTCGHDLQSPYFDFIQKEVHIEDNVVLYSNILIMPGVILSEGSVILPGAVVTKKTKPYTVYGGNPAQEISYRNKNLYYKLDYNNWFAN